jgi:hypothetical protein
MSPTSQGKRFNVFSTFLRTTVTEMAERDGRPHPQRGGESFFFHSQQSMAKPARTPAEPYWRSVQHVPEYEDYVVEQERKQLEQAEPAISSLFGGCVFYFLGFTGRGKDSRYNMGKVIERHGGRCVIIMSGQVTHILAQNVCHRRKQLLDDAIQRQKIAVVRPEYIDACVQAGRLLPPQEFATMKSKSPQIMNYFAPVDPD